MYKNWKAICQITDTHFIWALALLDLTTDFGCMVAERFPEYFSNEQQLGPIPWSIIKQKAIENNGEFADLAPVTWGAFKEYDIPLIKFDGSGECPHISEIENWLGESHSQGDVMDWKGKQLCLVEDSWTDGNDWAYFAPVKLIVFDK
ncbi:MAG: hypothetical protein UR66_C0002G0094 [Candidatus Moranbacteria bacterium GW2011_GWE1_35_17]|nr:MAG: hypothetical protein UR65_C0079G0009 [Candidatus Moranbacteria bacterium GW2011_GWE2_35_164]KKP69037.1 MAG: hypothetical protein UR66_C0002G0094 [Candidatus Moranbacteria bacterium GW2011_GWE1_35_17]KKP82177.1 MAG: hypothetical protein UR83_C0056G0014 [Candidatus Moranbacteria bacterium GW2011_GWF2_35_54]KKP84105.1 MAG: hypothetical protein UR82_C0012G0001 [Candidatus Moranbacteria bacterium GW2011_GWF1_35_5]